MSREFYVPCTPYAYQNSDNLKKRTGDGVLSNNFNQEKSNKQSIASKITKIRAKLPNFGDRWKRFVKSKKPREVDSEKQNVNSCELEKVNQANIDTFMLDEHSVARSNSLVYQPEHSVADRRTRTTCQDLASYFSEVDPDEPSTSVANTEFTASTFDRDVERTELSENLRSRTLISSVSALPGSELTETIRNSVNIREEISDMNLVNTLQRRPITFTSIGLQFSGNENNGVSETMQSRMQDQSVGPDEPGNQILGSDMPQEFYNSILHMMMYRPFVLQDNEPNLY